jgi:hypothetical protein
MVTAAMIGGALFWLGGFCRGFTHVFVGGNSFNVEDDWSYYEQHGDYGDDRFTAVELARERANPWGVWWFVLGAGVGLFGGYAMTVNYGLLDGWVEKQGRYSVGAMMVGVGVILVVFTAFSIFVTYGPLSFARWPWFRTACLLSLITCLVPYALAWPRDRQGGQMENGCLIGLAHGLLFVPCVWFLLYPGPQGLGLNSDRYAFGLIASWAIIHGIGVSIILARLQFEQQARLTSSNHKGDAAVDGG